MPVSHPKIPDDGMTRPGPASGALLLLRSWLLMAACAVSLATLSGCTSPGTSVPRIEGITSSQQLSRRGTWRLAPGARLCLQRTPGPARLPRTEAYLDGLLEERLRHRFGEIHGSDLQQDAVPGAVRKQALCDITLQARFHDLQIDPDVAFETRPRLTRLHAVLAVYDTRSGRLLDTLEGSERSRAGQWVEVDAGSLFDAMLAGLAR